MSGIQHAMDTLKNHGELFTAERLSVSVLENITTMLGRDLGVKLIPGLTWSFENGELTYDRATLLSLPPAAAPGLIFHNMGHARYSQTDVNLREAATKLAAACNRKVGPKSIHHSSILGMFDAVEDERMESRLRRKYKGLETSYLPRHDHGWRKEHFLTRYHDLAKVSPTGAIDEEGISVYWKRVAFGVRGIVSGAITKDNLPLDMPWSQQLCDGIAACRTAKTINEGLRAFCKLIPDLVKAREKYLEENQPPPPPPIPAPQAEYDNQFVKGEMEGIDQPGEKGETKDDAGDVSDDNDADDSDDGSDDPGNAGGDDETPEESDRDSQSSDNSNESSRPGPGMDSERSERHEESGGDNPEPGDDLDDEETEEEASEKAEQEGTSKTNPTSDGDNDSKSSGDSSSDEEPDDDGDELEDDDYTDNDDDLDDDEEDPDEDDDSSGVGEGNSSSESVDELSDDDLDVDGKFTEGEAIDEDLDDENESEGQGVVKDDLDSILEAESGDIPQPDGDKTDEVAKGTRDQTDFTFMDSTPEGYGGMLAGTNGGSVEAVGPSWEMVRKVVSDHANQIRRQMERFFKDNEISDKESGFKSGRFNAKSWVRSTFSGARNYYSRRTIAGEKSFGVYVLVDISGSMGSGGKGINGYPEAFLGTGDTAARSIAQAAQLRAELAHARRLGLQRNITRLEERLKDIEQCYQTSGAEYTVEQEFIPGKRAELRPDGSWTRRQRGKSVVTGYTLKGGYRWQFAIRMMIAIQEALNRFKEIKTGVGAFSSESHDYVYDNHPEGHVYAGCIDYSRRREVLIHNGFYPLKEFNNTLNPVVKQNIMDRLANPTGGTTLLPALHEIQHKFRKLSVDKKLLIILTDGMFGDDPAATKAQIKSMERDGIEMVVMTLAYKADSARKYLPATHAMQVDEDTVGIQMGAALKRMVKGR